MRVYVCIYIYIYIYIHNSVLSFGVVLPYCYLEGGRRRRRDALADSGVRRRRGE